MNTQLCLNITRISQSCPYESKVEFEQTSIHSLFELRRCREERVIELVNGGRQLECHVLNIIINAHKLGFSLSHAIQLQIIFSAFLSPYLP